MGKTPKLRLDLVLPELNFTASLIRATQTLGLPALSRSCPSNFNGSSNALGIGIVDCGLTKARGSAAL